jgi:hypothetical protein
MELAYKIYLILSWLLATDPIPALAGNSFYGIISEQQALKGEPAMAKDKDKGKEKSNKPKLTVKEKKQKKKEKRDKKASAI